MKIAANFERRRIARAIIKILLSVVLIVAAVLVFWRRGFRVFVVSHPGLIGVLIAVAGEVYFDWKEEVGKHAAWKRFFMALLVVSLAYELREASEADEAAADAARVAALANERAASSDLERMKIEKQMSSRSLKDPIGAANRLSKYAGTRAVIFCDMDPRSQDIGIQIMRSLQWAKWNVDLIPTSVTVPGVAVSLPPRSVDTGWMSEHEKIVRSLFKELIDSNIETSLTGMANPPDSFQGLIVQIGPRPTPDEAELISIENKIYSEDVMTTTERKQLSEREKELRLKINGESGGYHLVGRLIPQSLYPPQ